MHGYLIALGSNIGNRQDLVANAITEISGYASIECLSRFYRTDPIGAANREFLNAALTCTSIFAPDAMLAALIATEIKLGRTREVHWGNRTIDLDIILWQEDGVAKDMQTKTLTIPHPQALDRDFVLIPAAEIAPNWHFGTSRFTLIEEAKMRFFNRSLALFATKESDTHL